MQIINKVCRTKIRGEKMRAAILYEYCKPLKIEDVPTPVIGPKDVLINIKACGICHTDLNYMDGIKQTGKLPIILGHEPAGVISEIGDDVKGFNVGDRVVVYICISCGECKYCVNGRENLCVRRQFVGITVDGGFAEYLKVPASSLVKIPNEIPFEEAAILACGAITPYHALKDIANLRRGETLAVYGVGGLGMSAIQIAKALGARSILAVGRRREKLELAKRLGANFVIDASEENPPLRIKEFTKGEGVDVAIQLTPVPRLTEQAIESVGKGGKVVAVGWGAPESLFQVNTLDMLNKELRIMGCALGTKQNLVELVELMRSGKVSTKYMISNKISLEEINLGMDMVRGGAPIRVVVTLSASG
jgi:propanol-preferring alcohol dehydrogenase